MQAITVELQDSFSYLPVILFIIMGIIGTLLILFLKFKIKPRKPRVPVPKPAPPQSIMALKDKHIRALNQIEKRHTDGKISDRQAFQAVSRVVRDFVYAATGIKVHTSCRPGQNSKTGNTTHSRSRHPPWRHRGDRILLSQP